MPVLITPMLKILTTLPIHCISYRESIRNTIQLLLKKSLQLHNSNLVIKMIINKHVLIFNFKIENITIDNNVMRSSELQYFISEIVSTIYSLHVTDDVRKHCHQCLELISSIFSTSLIDILDRYLLRKDGSLKASLEERKNIALKNKNQRHIVILN